jgi:hypothetical protein
LIRDSCSSVNVDFIVGVVTEAGFTTTTGVVRWETVTLAPAL